MTVVVTVAATVTANVAATATGIDPALIRGIALFGPVLGVVFLLRRAAPPPREVAALILAVGWNVLALIAVNALAIRTGWWSFDVDGGAVAGVPVDLLLGWAVLWGGVGTLALRRFPPILLAGAAVWLDLALMPLGAPVVRLGGSWFTGEAVAAATALLPGLLLAAWTVKGRHLMVRVVLQAVLAVGLMVVLPVVLLATLDAGMADGGVMGAGVMGGPAWEAGLVLQFMLVPAGLTAAAVWEFARVGRGTPLPYDPPVRLVTTGPYAYVRNPMQTGMALTYLILAVLDPRLLVATVVAVTYGAGLAAWHEDAQLTAAYGEEWRRYRSAVRPWLPRLRPYAGTPGAVLWIAGDCERCTPVARWVERRSPVALTVRAAEEHPVGLRRMTYERSDGIRAEGVAAWAHATGHLHLGWAVLGWILSLPGVSGFARLCADTFGAGPARPPHPPRDRAVWSGETDEGAQRVRTRARP